MRLVGLMLASNNEENGRSYMDMVTACKETWIANRHPNVEVISTWGRTYQPYITTKIKEGEWIIGRGWHQDKWTDSPEKLIRGFPTHDKLSEAVLDILTTLSRAILVRSFLSSPK